MLEGRHVLLGCGNFSHYSVKALASALLRMCRNSIVKIKKRGDIIEEQERNSKKRGQIIWHNIFKMSLLL